MQAAEIHHSSPLPERLYPVAGYLCLVGVFLHMMLSGAVLYALGINYATLGALSDEGAFYEKIHPGTYFIYLSLFAMLWSRGTLSAVYRKHRIALLLLIFYIFILIYMVGRSGAGGLAFIPDAHMTAVICAIVLSFTPGLLCRKSVNMFMFFVVINSVIGIAEANGHFRLITYREEWPILNEEYFRASALQGHPLANAAFTSLALFTALGMRYSMVVKAALTVVFLTSLVAFGGRAALAVSVALLAVWAIPQLITMLREKRSIMHMLALAFAVVAVPVLGGAGLYAAINSGMGERIAAHARWDESADSRRLIFKALDYMKDEELILGVSGTRLVDISSRVDDATGAKGIENPWLIMFIILGGFFFPFWFALTAAFAWKLARDKPLALKLVILDYFLIASTSVSFGSKDAMYAVMVFAVVCASRALEATAVDLARERPATEAKKLTARVFPTYIEVN